MDDRTVEVLDSRDLSQGDHKTTGTNKARQQRGLPPPQQIQHWPKEKNRDKNPMPLGQIRIPSTIRFDDIEQEERLYVVLKPNIEPLIVEPGDCSHQRPSDSQKLVAIDLPQEGDAQRPAEQSAPIWDGKCPDNRNQVQEGVVSRVEPQLHLSRNIIAAPKAKNEVRPVASGMPTSNQMNR